MVVFSRLYSMIEHNPKRAFGVSFLFLILYQLISVFGGFELCDSGFYMTFYDQIWEAPESVSYNFMYYLSGIVGGGLIRLMPSAGLLEIRLLGVANNMAIVYLLYRMLRGHIHITAIIIGAILVVVSYIAMPMAFYNDLLTCLLYVVAIGYLLRGMDRDSYPYIIISGVVVGLNVFTRIPNLLGFGLIALIILRSMYYREPLVVALKRGVVFALSFIAAIGGMIALMRVWGHYSYFVANLEELTSIAGSDGGSSSHSISSMIQAQLGSYYAVLRLGIKLLIPTGMILFINRVVTNRGLCYTLTALLLVAVGYLFYRENPLLPLSLFCIIGLVGNLLLTRSNEVRMLSWAGLLMMVLIPIGSDGGMFNNGSVICWLAAPMAVSFYMTISQRPIWGVSIITVRGYMLLTLLLYGGVCGVKIVGEGCYFDGGSILEKRYTIDNERVSHIYTTQQRAAVINDLLVGIAPYLHKGECLLAYGSLPAVYYMTGTRPFAGCSWPELLTVELLSRRLDHYRGKLPIVLRQKFNSLGSDTYLPHAGYLEDCGIERGHFNSNEKQRVVGRFVEKHQYQAVFENDYFVLYLPPQ